MLPSLTGYEPVRFTLSYRPLFGSPAVTQTRNSSLEGRRYIQFTYRAKFCSLFLTLVMLTLGIYLNHLLLFTMAWNICSLLSSALDRVRQIHTSAQKPVNRVRIRCNRCSVRLYLIIFKSFRNKHFHKKKSHQN